MYSRKSERGQGLTEYGLAIILVAMVVLGVLQILGISIADYYTYIVDNLPFS
jgi:Flp pilus assembly pilin Flp